MEKSVPERFLYPSDTSFFFPPHFPLPHVICFSSSSSHFILFPLIFSLLYLPCLELQVPCNTPSCFCFSNPCSCSQGKEAGGMRTLQWCAGKHEGSQELEVGNLWGTGSSRNTLWTEFETLLKITTRATEGAEGENFHFISTSPALSPPLKSFKLS